MRNKQFRAPISCVTLAGLLVTSGVTLMGGSPAQTATPAPRPARSASSTTTSPVDNVIQLVKSGMSESLIIKTLQRQNKPVNLGPADLVKLQKAGVSENIINTMMDPTAAPAAAPPPAAAPAQPASAPAATTPPPAAGPTSSTPTPALSAAAARAQKERVIVDDFDYSTVMTSVQAVFGTTQNIGKGIRAMLTNKLATTGNVVIVERGKIDQLMKEQDRNQGNRVKQGTGAGVGKISGADLLLTGDITTFGRDDKHKGGGLGGLGGGWLGGAAAAISASKSEDKAVVSITYRLVDAETSEVIATGEARGESVRKSKALAAFAAGYNRGGYGAGGGSFDMTSSNFSETIIGEATQDCVNKLSDVMNAQVSGMKKTQHQVEATVADVSGSMLTITAGTNDGVNAGDVFEILRVTREVKDPTTKEVLDRLTEKVGEMTITSVRDKIASGNYQGLPPQVSYLARKKI
jgi:curli biogenesis system outer membrane secretion channel CsgG